MGQHEGITMNKRWRQIEETLYRQGIESVTNKLGVGGRDCYFKIGWNGGRPVHVDLTIGTGQDHLSGDVQTNELATAAAMNARAAIEVICRHASALLQAHVWSLNDMIGAWRATAFEPQGVCPELQEIVSSPLDAAARLCERRKAEWYEQFGGSHG